MPRLLMIGLVLFFVVVILLVVSLAATLLVVFAYWLGGLFMRFLPFETGQATLLALIAIIATSAILAQVLNVVLTPPVQSSPPKDTSDELDDDDDDYDDEEDEEEDEEDDDDDEPVAFVASVPRWRQPIKPVTFEGANLNGPCPCGSGRKYKNCHGRTSNRSSSSSR